MNDIIIWKIPLYFGVFIIPIIFYICRKTPHIIIGLFIAQPWILNYIYMELPGLPYIYISYIPFFFIIVRYGEIGIPKFTNKPLFIVMLIFLLYLIFSFLIHPSSTHSIGLLRNYLSMTIIPAAFIDLMVRQRNDIYKMFWATSYWLLFFQISFILSGLLYFIGDNFENLRVISILGVNIQYANSALSFLMSLVILLIIKQKQKIGYLLLGLSILNLFVSQSRTFLLGAILLFVILIIKYKRYLLRNIINLVIITIIMGFVLNFLIKKNIKDTILDGLASRIELTESNNIDEASAGRFEYWDEAINQFLKTPILGTGLGNSLTKFERIDGTVPRTHNMYVQILSELGVIGFLIFLIFLFYSIKNVVFFKNIKSSYFFFFSGGFILFAFSNFFKADWGLTFLFAFILEKIRLLIIKEKKILKFGINNNPYIQ